MFGNLLLLNVWVQWEGWAWFWLGKLILKVKLKAFELNERLKFGLKSMPFIWMKGCNLSQVSNKKLINFEISEKTLMFNGLNFINRLLNASFKVWNYKNNE